MSAEQPSNLARRRLGLEARVLRRGGRVLIRAPWPSDQDSFLEAVRRSRPVLRPWSYPPSTAELFRAYVERSHHEDFEGFLVIRQSDQELIGAFNLSQIFRKGFQNAYLGYYAFAPHHGQGYMSEGLDLTLAQAFKTLGLHRIEANIQPENLRSIALVRRSGFRREGFSPRYLKIGGRWRDHERWAIIREEFRLGA